MFTTRTVYLGSMVSTLAVPPEISINIEPQDTEPQDEGSIPMALYEEGRQEEHEQPPPHPEPQPEPQPQLRRSVRIKAKKDAVPPNAKTPAKSTSRKRAVRK